MKENQKEKSGPVLFFADCFHFAAHPGTKRSVWRLRIGNRSLALRISMPTISFLFATCTTTPSLISIAPLGRLDESCEKSGPVLFFADCFHFAAHPEKSEPVPIFIHLFLFNPSCECRTEPMAYILDSHLCLDWDLCRSRRSCRLLLLLPNCPAASPAGALLESRRCWLRRTPDLGKRCSRS